LDSGRFDGRLFFCRRNWANRYELEEAVSIAAFFLFQHNSRTEMLYRLIGEG
jgi:hypothetical protein